MLWSLLTSYLAIGVVVAQSSVEQFISTEYPIAKSGLLANIGPSGSKSSGAKSGVVIASPSTVDPDYLYTWTRDSSLVFQTIIEQYVVIRQLPVYLANSPNFPCRFTLGLDNTLRPQIDNFVASQARLQQVSNPSGTITSGGLGEPKFHIDETAFTGGWG